MKSTRSKIKQVHKNHRADDLKIIMFTAFTLFFFIKYFIPSLHSLSKTPKESTDQEFSDRGMIAFRP